MPAPAESRALFAPLPFAPLPFAPLPFAPLPLAPLPLAPLLAAAFTFGLAGPATAEDIRLSVTRDTWVSAVGSERLGNNGASPRVKLKGIQEFTVLDADCTALRGKTIVRATLHLRQAGEERLGRVTVSTLTAPWTEGGGVNYAVEPGAACFALPGTTPDITSAMLGQGGSIWGWGDASAPDGDGWQRIPVDPQVMQARAEGRSEGFAVLDDVGSEYTRTGDRIDWRLMPNRFFFSRDQNAASAPYFTVEVTKDAPPPLPAPAPGPAPVLAREVPLPVALDQPAPRPAASLPGISLTDLWGAPVRDLMLARNEATWLLVRGKDLAAPQVQAAGLKATVSPVGALGDALGTRDGKPMATAEAWLVELYAPDDAKPGEQTIVLQAGAAKSTIPARVLRFALPDRLSFVPQMNAYGLPPNERDFYRLAHDHRTCLNVLRYSWRGVPANGCVPVKRADGRWDWSAWDARFGPLLNGSAFAGLRRNAEPVDAFYLPLNENWPMDHERHFRGGYWIEDAYPEAYWSEFREAAGAFAGHAAMKKWSRPVFEFYLNGKVYFKADRNSWAACSSPWVFDEPVNTQDFWALRRFGREFLAGVGAPREDVRMAFRCDISRPEWQRDLLDGVCGVEVVSGALRPYRERILRRQERHGQRVLMYGSAADIGSPVLHATAWCLDAWCLGADGVVPWQTIGTGDSWTTPDARSLFYPTSDSTPPVPSLRLKAFTAGQQLVEYLTLLQHAGNHRREDVARLVRQALGLDGVLRKSSDDDAGTMDYAALAPQTLAAFRQRVAAALEALAPATLEAAAAATAAILDQRPPPYASDAMADPAVQKLAP